MSLALLYYDLEEEMAKTGIYAHLDDMAEIEPFVSGRIEKLKEQARKTEEELRIWRKIEKLLQTCTNLAEEEAQTSKKGELRLKWVEFMKNCWVSDAGSVNKKAWGKYIGFPKCLEHLAPYGEDDKSSRNMVHRPKYRDVLCDDTADFDTLIDCQLAVEKAHFEHLEQTKTVTK